MVKLHDKVAGMTSRITTEIKCFSRNILSQLWYGLKTKCFS